MRARGERAPDESTRAVDPAFHVDRVSHDDVFPILNGVRVGKARNVPAIVASEINSGFSHVRLVESGSQERGSRWLITLENAAQPM